MPSFHYLRVKVNHSFFGFLGAALHGLGIFVVYVCAMIGLLLVFPLWVVAALVEEMLSAWKLHSLKHARKNKRVRRKQKRGSNVSSV